MVAEHSLCQLSSSRQGMMTTPIQSISASGLEIATFKLLNIDNT